MSLIRIQGGVPLQGTVSVAGSKNSALAILSSVVLASEPVSLHNIPEISDIAIKADLLRKFGAEVSLVEGSLFIDCSTLKQGKADETTVRLIRTSFYLLGPLLARLGSIEMPMPGGCKIGARPVDLHLKGLALMGVDIHDSGGIFYAKTDHLKGADILLDFPSAGATQHLMATATLADGCTVIQNAAMEPEVVALARFLKTIGAKIEGEGTSTITIQGRPQLGGGTFRVPADRMQAGTYMLAAAITRGDVTVTGVLPEEHAAVIQKLKEAGASVVVTNDSIRVSAKKRLKAVHIRTMPHPGFPTDMQQPFSSLLTLAEGTSTVEETIYESRTGHVPELIRMGASMRVTEGNMTVNILGVDALSGANVVASDLRAGAALVLAGLAASGETHVSDVQHIDRGYHRLEETLRQLGARVERVDTDNAGTTGMQEHTHRD